MFKKRKSLFWFLVLIGIQIFLCYSSKGEDNLLGFNTGTSDTFELKISSEVSASPGEENVAVPISLLSSDSVYSFNLFLTFDPSILTPTMVAPALFFQYFDFDISDPGKIRVTGKIDVPNAPPHIPPIPPRNTVLLNILFNITPRDLGSDYLCYIHFSDDYNTPFPDNFVGISNGYVVTIPKLILTDGAILIQSPLYGDLNLDGIPYTVPDAILFINFLLGRESLNSAQLINSDVNRDGLLGTVADLIFLIDVLNGYQEPMSKSSPFLELVKVYLQNGVDGDLLVCSDFNRQVGGIHFVFEYDPEKIKVGEPVSSPRCLQMIIASHKDNGEFRVLIYSLDDQTIDPGDGSLFTIPIMGEGELSLSNAACSDEFGNLMKVRCFSSILPQKVSLKQNYPNPFNSETVIPYSIDYDCPVHIVLNVYNSLGRLVKNLFNGVQSRGSYTVTWNGKDRTGQIVSSGVYFCQITVDLPDGGDISEVKKMILME